MEALFKEEGEIIEDQEENLVVEKQNDEELNKLFFDIPDNASFAVQGAVDASTRIHRLKYETITDSANSLRAAYGDATANALAYGVSEQGYTEKTVVGDKPKYTPVINPLNGQICKRRFIYRPR